MEPRASQQYPNCHLAELSPCQMEKRPAPKAPSGSSRPSGQLSLAQSWAKAKESSGSAPVLSGLLTPSRAAKAAVADAAEDDSEGDTAPAAKGGAASSDAAPARAKDSLSSMMASGAAAAAAPAKKPRARKPAAGAASSGVVTVPRLKEDLAK